MKLGKGLWAVLAVGSALALGACGDDSDGGSATATTGGGGDAPETVTIGLIMDETGLAGFAGSAAKKGFELGIEEANANDALGGTKIEIEYGDAATDIKQASSLATKMTRDDDVRALVFGTQGSEALAVAPIADRAGVPTVFIYSGGPGVVETGEGMFRVTAPQSTYTHLALEHLANEGAKRISIIYNSDHATLNDLATKVYPELAEENGVEIVSSTGVSLKETEYGQAAKVVADADPDAVVLLLAGAPNVTAISALERAGWEGKIVGQPGIAGGILEPLGKKANGIVYPLDFAATTESPVGKAFVETYEAETGEEANTYSAAGYDAALMLVEGLKAADGYSREEIQAGLTKVAESGFEGAAGEITFENRDARVPGLLVEYQDGKEVVIEP
jgi:branched-chain amino acid transport system substrate-binding protein